MSALIPYLVGSFGGAALIALVLFLNPEKTEQWGLLLWELIYKIFKRGQKKATTLGIQGKVNSFVRRLNRDATHGWLSVP